jgi:hypothetical protein
MKETCPNCKNNYERRTSRPEEGEFDYGSLQYRVCTNCNRREVLKSTGWKRLY